MPVRAPKAGIYGTSRGIYNTRKHTFAGKGSAPAGYRKVSTPTINEIPVTTTYPSGRTVRTQPGRAPVQLSPPSPSTSLDLLQLNDLLTPGPTAKETAEVAHRLGVKPKGDGLAATISKAISTPVDAVAHDIAKGVQAASQAVKSAEHLPGKRVDNFLGRKTLGKLTLRQLLGAAAHGKTRINQRGKLTIPVTREAARRLAHLRDRQQRLTAPLPGLDPEQTKVARTVLRRGTQAGATRREKLAAIETGLVESGLHNLGYGDADSQGWRQERTSLYGTGPTGPRNVRASADRFFQEVRTDPGTTSAPTAGLLAQAAQGSAFPERYDEHKPEALAILRAFEHGGKPGPALAAKLKAAAAQAQRLGIPTTPAQATLDPPPRQTVTRFKAALVAARELNKAQLPYVWGGGHNAGKVQIGAGVDCSGAVSFVLQKMGVKLPGGVVSGDMGNYLEPGPGAVTVFYNPEHTFMKIGDKFFGTSRSNPGGGAGFIPASVAGPEAKSGQYSVGHVPGLGAKVALQMGIEVSGASGGGIVYGPDGTTATVTGGATKTKPGFSSSPILSSGAPVSPLLNAAAALPAAYQQFQEGEPPPAEAVGKGIIGEILRRKRL